MRGCYKYCIFTHFSQNGSWTRNSLSKLVPLNSKSQNFVQFQEKKRKKKRKTSINVFGSFLVFSFILYISSLTNIAFLLTELGYLAFRNRGNSNWEEQQRIPRFAVDFCPKCLSKTLTRLVSISIIRQQCSKFCNLCNLVSSVGRVPVC